MAQTTRNAMLVVVCLGVALACMAAPANPGTNLNGIPIADVLAWRSFELSTWTTTGEREEPVWWGA
ncbi:unnamed protein product, partial [marine sediment metagenome]